MKKAKQITALLLAVSLICTATACDKKNISDTDTATSATQVSDYTVNPSSQTASESSTEKTSVESTATTTALPEKASVTHKTAARNKAPKAVRFINRKAYYEFNDSKLNSLIDKITKINCGSMLDMDKYVKNELKEININSYFNSTNVFPDKNYSWIKNGTIDTDALYSRILNNNIASGKPTTDQIKEYIQITAEAAQKDYEFLKRNYPDFKMSYFLYKLNTLKVGLTEKKELMGSYNREQHTIVFNPNNLTGGYDEILITAGHELYHVGLEVNETNYIVYQCGTSIDVLSNINTALDLTFMSENYADSMSYEAMELYNPMCYTKEFQYISFIASSCVVDRSVLRKAFVCMDNSKLIDIFEPEMQDYVKITSAFSYANCACGYGSFDSVEFDSAAVTDCNENFFTFMIKNYYIKQLKRYYYDEIDKKELEDLLTLINSFTADFDVENDKIRKIIKQMTDIVLSCK